MLGEKIREQRTRARLSQRQLGTAIGHESGNYISKLERDDHDPRTQTLRAIARTLGCTVGYLLGEEVTSETDEAA